MIGFILALVSGVSMSVQGIFNTRASEKIGTWQTNVFVQGTAFFLALLVFLILKSGNFSEIKNVNKLYLTGGILAVIITFTVMEAIKRIGITTSISTILLAQLTSAALIDCFGFFGANYSKFDKNKLVGTIVMITGIIIFKHKG